MKKISKNIEVKYWSIEVELLKYSIWNWKVTVLNVLKFWSFDYHTVLKIWGFTAQVPKFWQSYRVKGSRALRFRFFDGLPSLRSLIYKVASFQIVACFHSHLGCCRWLFRNPLPRARVFGGGALPPYSHTRKNFTLPSLSPRLLAVIRCSRSRRALQHSHICKGTLRLPLVALAYMSVLCVTFVRSSLRSVSRAPLWPSAPSLSPHFSACLLLSGWFRGLI